MSRKHRENPKPAAPPEAASVAPTGAAGWKAFVLGNALGLAVGPILRLISVVFLGAAIVFLTVAWQNGPQRTLDARRYADFTAHADGRIVDRWLALEFDPAVLGEGSRWRGAAKATPCAIVEYQGDSNAPLRRAFCGNRIGFNESYTLHDLREMAPKIPFGWALDGRGFAAPEIRLDAAAREWLATHAPDAPLPSDPPPANSSDALRLWLDRPIEYMLAGWTAPESAFPLALDPKNPIEAMPQHFVESKRDAPSGWWVFAIIAPLGLILWFRGMSVLLSGMPRAAALFAAIVPLLAIPWWGDRIPLALRHIDSDFAGVIAEMLGDIDITGRLVASAPEDAALAGGERMVWRVGEGKYASTIGQIKFTRPSTPASADAAFAALLDTTTQQVGALGATERIALFDRLRADKLADLRNAGALFVPAAIAAVRDAADPAVQNSARRFLTEWVTQPIQEPDPRDAAFAARVRQFRDLSQVPVPEIANMAVGVADRAEAQK
ncbi:MAG: hypothetical protein ACREPX_13215 [Rhodanobacteraceae bacterium]